MEQSGVSIEGVLQMHCSYAVLGTRIYTHYGNSDHTA